MTLYSELQWRGLVKQTTDAGIEKFLNENKVTLYCGFDPTSDSLHIGSLLPLLTLRRFQKDGHRVIALAGGATGMIGDPSGKSQERNLLSSEQIKKNVDGIQEVIAKFLDLDGSNPARVVNNGDWFEGIGFIEFLRDTGKHFSVNAMMAKDSVKSRLEDREQGISYTEFSYMLLQAYDFYYLHQKEGCTLQIGGSDQWGNITAGCELIRRAAAAQEKPAPSVFGLTFPLILKADGEKFGKTESGTIWLDPKRTSPYQFYQFLLQTSDADVIHFLKSFTFLSQEEIQSLENSLQTEPEKRLAQKALAEDLTTLVHGAEETQRVQNASGALFGSEIKDLDGKTLLEIFADTPSTQKKRSELESGNLLLVDLLVDSGLCKSKGMARKDVTAGGIYINNERVQDPAFALSQSELIANQSILLRKGKKNYHLVSFS